MGGEGEGDIVMGRRLSFSFERGPAAAGEAEVFSRGSMSVGDYVAVSVQAWDVASCGEDAGALVPNMTSGFVDVVSAATVAVLVDRDIVHWCGSRSRDARRVVWRIDAEEIVASFSTAKATVESLFVADESGGNGKVRGLVADLRPPTFTPLDDVGLASIGSLADKLAERGMALNDEQTHALRRSREARDYMLLLGMPGTGKTATLATIVLAAVDSGQTVLLCSHTRTAVDNILVRLLDLGFTNFVRVGALGASGDGRLEPFHVPSESSLSVDELAQRLETPSVVATTCLGISHAVFARRTAFDLVLVDEASQILQPICIGPLRLASSAFVLVGDHYQLPPLLRSAGHRRAPAATADPAVADVAMDVCVPLGAGGGGENPRESLFRRLCEAHPEAVVSLVRQYRMAADIMRLSNTLVYSGHLSCGTPAVASRMLELHAGGPSNVPRWLGAVLNPARRVVFLDTDALGAEAADAAGPDPVNEHRSKSSARQSPVEGAIIATAVAALCARGLAGDAIAVLSPFRAQVAHLRNVLQASVAGTGDVCTIDQYQGKDKECVFVSFVRSNEANSVGPLLLDWRRINVAITRARSKLILVGSASTLAGGSLFLREMVATLRTQGAIAAVDEPPSVPEQRTGDTSDPTGHTREAGTLDSAVKQGRTSGRSS
jgi:DNA replication ATP-dependent helicase Dna2